MAVAPQGGGPILSRASLHFTLHRLDAAAAELDRAAALHPLVRPRPDVLLQRGGALALQMGSYEEARQLLEQAVELEPNLGNLSTLALWHWKTGDIETAEALYDAAEETYRGRSTEPRAWLDLQRGLLDLDRGRYAEALAHYRDAERDLTGWYLVDEHIAEVVRLLGDREEARSIYLRVVASTGNPEFMDALADMAREDGDQAGQRAWTRRARAAYEAQLLRFPEAASGHALEHFLDSGERPDRALAIARRNHTNRPNGEAKTLLARAALAAGDLDEAQAAVQDALASAWRTADLHSVAAEVYGALGDSTTAAQQVRLALQINPRALD
jgi:tetratricopeptide (TPR) repeat protein